MAPNFKNQGWIGIALSFYAFIAIGIAEGGLGVLIPSIQTTYNLSAATITLLFISQVTGYVIAAFSSSLLSSRIGLARMLLLASTTLTLALVIYALSPSWLVMVAAGTLLGLGIGIIDAGINTYIASQQDNADLMGILHAFYGVGALLGPAVATSLLAINLNWRQVYLVIAAVVSVTIVGMLWAVVNNYKPLNKKASAANTNGRENLSVALRTPKVLIAGLLLFVYVGVEASIGNWAFSVQSKARSTPVTLAGYSVSAYWFGLTIGRAITGRVVKYIGATRTLDFSFTLLVISVVAWWLLPQQLFSLPLMGLALAAIFPMVIWLVPQRVSPQIVPAAIGFMTSVASLGAAGIPTILGWFAARFGLNIIPILLLPLAIIMLILHRLLK
jgi:fucose permease